MTFWEYVGCDVGLMLAFCLAVILAARKQTGTDRQTKVK